MATPTGAAAGATSQNTETNVDQPQNRDPNAPRARQLSPREQLIEGLAERATLERQEDQRRYEAERAAEESGEAQPGEQTTVATAAPAATPAATSSEPAVNLDEHIVVQNGKPMLKLKVDGKEKLMPLDSARATLQKATAADQRLAQAAERQRTLDNREIALRAKDTELRTREAALTARSSQPAPAAASPAAAPAVDDQSLDNEARGIVQSLLQEDPNVAAAKLATTLKKVRQTAPAQPAQPAIDPQKVKNEATAAAVHQIRYENAMAQGFNDFSSQYGEIASDPVLMQLADGKTTEIAKAHPEWTPSQVMLEAGRQTREWVVSIRGPAPAETKTPPAAKPGTDRETAKRNLRPMPAARTATPVAATTEPERDDPAAALREMRKSRGQPV